MVTFTLGRVDVRERTWVAVRQREVVEAAGGPPDLSRLSGEPVKIVEQSSKQFGISTLTHKLPEALQDKQNLPRC